jgi:hypothetical protein
MPDVGFFLKQKRLKLAKCNPGSGPNAKIGFLLGEKRRDSTNLPWHKPGSRKRRSIL